MINYIPYYRIQGGDWPNRSKKNIKVHNNKLHVPFKKNIYIGDKEHMMHFLRKRTLLVEDKVLGDLEVIVLYQPIWFDHIIRKYAVEQLFSKNETNHDLKLVDPRTPGNSYQLRANWSELLRFSNMHVVRLNIKDVKSLNDALLFSHDKLEFNYLSYDFNELEQKMKNCEISNKDIEKVREMINSFKEKETKIRDL